MIYQRRIVIDIACDYSQDGCEKAFDAIAASVEDNASAEAATSFLVALKTFGLDEAKIKVWDVSSFNKELDDGD